MKTVAALGLGLLCAAAAAAEPACGRQCLRDALDRYLEAVFRHDPGKAPLAAHVRGTENGAVVAVGDGIWRTAEGYGALQRRFMDPVTLQAAYFGEITEGAAPAIVSLRLRLEGRSIVETEWTIARRADGTLFSPEQLRATPPPEGAVLEGERTPRPAALAAARAYFDALQNHSGARVPHVSGCERLENGFKVTNRAGGASSPGGPEMRFGDCASGLEAFADLIAGTSHRRFPLVDEAAGVVMGTTILERPPGSTRRRNLLTEYFFLRGGKILAIYAAMHYMDPTDPDSPGWE